MSDRYELQESQACEIDHFEYGRRAAGQDVPPFGDLDTLIRAYERRFLADSDWNNPGTAITIANQQAESCALEIIRTHLRQRETDHNLRRAIHYETLRVQEETRAITRTQEPA